MRRVVTDFGPMRDRLRALTHVHPALQWLADGQFVFLGAIDTTCDDAGNVAPIPGTGLGQLADADPDAVAAFTFPTSDALEMRPALMARADVVSTVFRPQRLSVLIVNDAAEDEDGHGVQHRFVGLLSTTAQRASVLDIPGFGDRIAVELGLIGEAVHGHTGRAARTVLENLPRDVVLELSPEEVAELVREIVGLQERRVVRVFEVPEPAGLWTTVLVYFPRNRFSAELPERLADIVAEAYRSEQRTFESLVSASSLARLAVSVRRPSADTHADLAALERTIDQQSISWTDRLRTALVADLGEAHGHHLFEIAGQSAPAAYRAAVAPERAVADLRRLEEVLTGEDDLAVALGHDLDASSGEWRIRVYRRGTPMVLADLLPLLDHLGFVALDEQPYTFRVGGGRVYLYDIGIRVPDGVVLDSRRSQDVIEAFVGVIRGTIESDGFNRLVVMAGLDARAVSLIRAYAKYLRQIGLPSASSTWRRRWAATPGSSGGSSICSRPASTRPPPGIGTTRGGAAGADRPCARRHPQSRRGPHLPHLPHPHRRHGAHELLQRWPHAGLQARSGGDPGAAAAAAGARDLGVRAARRGRPPSRRPDRPRWVALERPS